MNETIVGILAIFGGCGAAWMAYSYCLWLEQSEYILARNTSSFVKKAPLRLPSLALALLLQREYKDGGFYLLGEVATIGYIIFAASMFSPGLWEGTTSLTPYSSAAIVFGVILIVLSLIDFRTQLLPDIFTFPLIALGFLQAYFNLFTDLPHSILGALVGYGLFWGINTLFRLIRKKEGMGGGDFKLMAALGAWLGIYSLPLILMIAPVVGILCAMIRTVFTGTSIKEPFPFGPALALGGLVALYGQKFWFSFLGIL
ncbi:MAG: pilD [Rickettsiales bacterium]|jgi:prepilin signal peptidase PulO-like enzyme (type II secretory pathway)|nr:pilD [Rickettsiales bacterium]